MGFCCSKNKKKEEAAEILNKSVSGVNNLSTSRKLMEQ